MPVLTLLLCFLNDSNYGNDARVPDTLPRVNGGELDTSVAE
jgi:hypothetical protein